MIYKFSVYHLICQLHWGNIMTYFRPIEDKLLPWHNIQENIYCKRHRNSVQMDVSYESYKSLGYNIKSQHTEYFSVGS